MTSLRLRLLVPLGVGLTLLLIVGGAMAYEAVRAALVGSLDETLLAEARSVAGHLELRVAPQHRARVEALGAAAFGASGDAAARAELLGLAGEAFRVHLADRGRLDPGYASATEGAFYEILLPDGATLARSPSLGAGRLGTDEAPGTERRWTWSALPDGRPGRVLRQEVREVPFADETWQRAWDEIRGSDDLPALGATVIVAEATASVDAFLATLRRALLGFLVVLVLGGGVLAVFLIRRGLAPLTVLSRRIAALDPAALSERIDLAAPPAELVPLVGALNQRLAALEEAFDRERRTTAHIAHELRTPIAELRTLTEVALQFPDDATLQAESLEQGHEATVHMSQVVEAVLRLARARSSDGATTPEPLQLAPIVAATWEGLRGSSAARDQALASELADDLVVHADREATEALIANLIGNAVRHAPTGSTIEIGSRDVSGRVVLSITNPSTDLQPEDLDRLTEPYWRKDAARSASEQGGLGLALAKEWARAASADLTFALGGGTFTAALHFSKATGGR